MTSENRHEHEATTVNQTPSNLNLEGEYRNFRAKSYSSLKRRGAELDASHASSFNPKPSRPWAPGSDPKEPCFNVVTLIYGVEGSFFVTSD